VRIPNLNLDCSQIAPHRRSPPPLNGRHPHQLSLLPLPRNRPTPAQTLHRQKQQSAIIQNVPDRLSRQLKIAQQPKQTFRVRREHQQKPTDPGQMHQHPRLTKEKLVRAFPRLQTNPHPKIIPRGQLQNRDDRLRLQLQIPLRVNPQHSEVQLGGKECQKPCQSEYPGGE
jgi:hypothetical protein